MLLKDSQTGATLDMQSGEWKDAPAQMVRGVIPLPPKGFSQAYSPWTSPSTKFYFNHGQIGQAVQKLTDPNNTGNPSYENAAGKSVDLDVWDPATNATVKGVASFNSGFTKLMVDVNAKLPGGEGSRRMILIPLREAQP